MTYGDILRDYWERMRQRQVPHLKAEIRLVQLCAAISATAELLYN